MTPINQEVLGWKMYPMHAGFCVVSFLLVFFTYPESTPPISLLLLTSYGLLQLTDVVVLQREESRSRKWVSSHRIIT